MPAAPMFGSARLPLILQGEVAECGLACLAMVASCLGLRTDLATIRGRFSVPLNGTSDMDNFNGCTPLRTGATTVAGTMGGSSP